MKFDISQEDFYKLKQELINSKNIDDLYNLFDLAIVLKQDFKDIFEKICIIAEEFFEKAVDENLFINLKDHKSYIRAYYELAISYWNSKLFKESIKTFLVLFYFVDELSDNVAFCMLFVDDNMDIDKFIEKFTKESNEFYFEFNIDINEYLNNNREKLKAILENY